MATISGRECLLNPNMRYRVIIKFSELKDSSGQSLGLSDFLTEYNGAISNITYNDNVISQTFVDKLKFDFIDSNCDVNLLGVSESSTALVEIVDIGGLLSPDNEDSPYFGALVNGVHVEIYQGDIYTNTILYTKYGDWYITGVQSMLEEGGYQPIQISLQDKLNLIGNMDITNDNGELAALSGLTGAEILDQLLSNVVWNGNKLVKNTDYIIDSGIISVTDKVFGVTAGSKVRDVINNVCRTLLARCYIRLDGVIYIEKFNKVHTDNVWDIQGMSGIMSINNSNAMYSDICVKYHTRKQTASELIKTVEVPSLPDEDYPDWPTNEEITLFVGFDKPVASIDRMEVHVPVGESDGDDEDWNDYDAYAEIKSWTGWSTGCYITILLRGGAEPNDYINNVTIDIYGHTIKGDGSVTKNYKIYEGVVTPAIQTLVYDTDQIMTKSAAKSLANQIAQYFKYELRKKTIQSTVYSLHMQVGDKLVISNTNANFDGNYRITAISISIDETYDMSMELTHIH